MLCELLLRMCCCFLKGADNGKGTGAGAVGLGGEGLDEYELADV